MFAYRELASAKPFYALSCVHAPSSPTPLFKCIPAHRLIGMVKETIERPDLQHPGDPAFTLILGAGFSAGIIPTTQQMMHEEIGPWDDGKSDEKRAVLSKDEKRAATRAYWERFRQANPESQLEFTADGADKGMPTSPSEAYQVLHHGDSLRGLNSPERAHSFMDSMNARGWSELNGAHFFLSALMEEQQVHPKERPFCRIIFTTNFDPLLQTGLQLFRQLYFMTDGAELKDDPGQLRENRRALHLIYAHGLLQRPDLASATTDIGKFHSLAGSIASYMQNRGVIVIGSGGWDDCLMKALTDCPRFARNLYWCNHYSEAEAAVKLSPGVKELLGKDPSHRFYVSLPGGADAFMAQLYRALYPTPGQPSLLSAPLSGLERQINSLKLDDIPLASTPTKSLIPPGFMKEVLQDVRFRLGHASKAYDAAPYEAQRATPEAFVEPVPSTVPTVSALVVELQAYDAYSAGDIKKAVELLNQALFAPDATPESIGRALINRGVLHGKEGRPAEALADYSRVTDSLPGAPVEQIAQALFNRGVLHRQQQRLAEALADYSRVIDSLPDVPVEHIAKALVNRGVLHGKEGRPVQALADFNRVIDSLPGAPVEQIAQALVNRGVLHAKEGRPAEELADYSRVIDSLPGAPVEQIAKALVNRGFLHGKEGRPAEALTDYSRVIDSLPGTPVEQIAQALVNRGVLHGEEGRPAEELADYSRVIDSLPGAPVERIAQALFNRGVLHRQQQRPAEALADYSRVIDSLPGTPVEHITKALVNRGVLHREQQRPTEALADYSRVINSLPGAPVEHIARALVNRGVLHGKEGRPAEALADYSRVIDSLPGAPVEQIAQALVNRGFLHREQQKPPEELADYSRVIDSLPGAPVEHIARALVNRGVLHGKEGRSAEALADYSRLIDSLPGAPVELIAKALANRGFAHYKNGGGDPQLFLSDTQRSLKLDDHSHAVFNLGLAFLFSGMDAEAFAAYQSAIARSLSQDEITEMIEDLNGAQAAWLSMERAQPILALLQKPL